MENRPEMRCESEQRFVAKLLLFENENAMIVQRLLQPAHERCTQRPIGVKPADDRADTTISAFDADLVDALCWQIGARCGVNRTRQLRKEGTDGEAGVIQRQG